MRPSITAFAAISALCRGVLGSRCDDKDGICLTSFRWCDVNPCEFPENMYPLHEDLDRTTGYAILDEWENYTVSWTGARSGEHVQVRWGLGMPTGQMHDSHYPRVSWGKSMWENMNDDSYFD